MVSVRRTRLFFLVPLLVILFVLFHFSFTYTNESYNEFIDHWIQDSNPAVADTASVETDVVKSKQDEQLEFLMLQDSFSPIAAPVNNQTREFFKSIFQLYADNKPETEIHIKKPTTSESQELTKSYLSQFISLKKSQLNAFKTNHENVFNALPSSFPSIYRGTGVVYIGGGQFSWLAILSIANLRETGSTLPVEVIIPSHNEYEFEFCDLVLPKLNGKCVVLSDFYGDEIMSHWKFKGYQYKSLGILASSFSKVLFLDSDNLILSNPDDFFTNEVFESGMIVWPDYWKRTTSPLYYDIAGIDVEEQRARVGRFPLLHNTGENANKIPFHDLKGTIPDLSSESGQLMVDKHTHTKTLLLSLYYNLYGPGYYYPLFSQGQQGEGDKDTFIAAAVKSGEPFYQVKSKIKTFGYFEKDEFHGIAMGQKNPIQDYNKFKTYEQKLVNFGESVELLNNEENLSDFDQNNGNVFTIHSNFPKLNPLALKDNGNLFDGDGNLFRRYGDIKKYAGYDFELKMWERINLYLCEMNLSFKDFDGIRRDELCKFIIEELIFLRKNPI